MNINKQHLNFLDKNKKTLDEVIYQKVGFLSNFTNIYVGSLVFFLNVLFLNKKFKKNKSKINYPKSWKLIKKNNKYFYHNRKNSVKFSVKLKNQNIHSKGL